METQNIKHAELPFTIYDFFGYLLPGISFIMLLLIPSDAKRALEYAVHANQPPPTQQFHPFLTGAFIDFFHSSPWFVTGYSLVIGYILGHIIAAISSYILEAFLVKKWLLYPASNLFSIKTKPDPFWFKKYREGYKNNFSSKFKEVYTKQFKIPLDDPSAAFWLPFEFVAQNCPAAFARSIHFLNLYGFSRNLSMSFILASTAILVYDVAFGFHIAWIFAVAYLFIAGLLFWNYLKLLKRLTDEVFQGFYSFVVTHRRGA